MATMTAIMIDDEKSCRDNLQKLLAKHCPEVTLMGIYENGKAGLEAIGELQPELVFLDIQMPVMGGFQLMEALETINFEVIFTTAHEHFALKAIKFSALDYLVKPVKKDELVEAVQKAISKKGKMNPTVQLQHLLENLSLQDSQQKKIALSTPKGYQFVSLQDIVRVEAVSNYTDFYLTNGQKILVTQTLKLQEQLLKDHDFFRIHYSHLINMNYIKEYVREGGGHVVMNDGTEIPIAKNRRKVFMQRIKQEF